MIKTRKNKIILISSGLLLGVVLGFIMSGHFSIPSCTADTSRDTAVDWQRNITSISLPTEAFLFDKKIPLDNWEVRGRFEREFYYNYTNSDQLLLWWKRLKRWEPMIDSMLDAASLSHDFKYLMIAESGIRNVQSPAGANGYWQFISGTAQMWGLRVDQYVDDRLDPILSTQAAIRYLLKLKVQFNNDNLLVAAAYNMGESGLDLALSIQHQSNYWNLYLNEETMRYPLRIAVIKELLERGARYGFHFEKTESYLKFSLKTVVVQGPISSIADWAIREGYSYKDVKTFNPRFIGKTIPSGSYDILLPANDAQRATVR